MAGYAASSTLHGAVPHRAGPRSSAANDQLPTSLESWPSVQVELVGRPLDSTIRDWLASIGESWSQLTFYLFDPESWR